MSAGLSQEQLAKMAGLTSADRLLTDSIHDSKAYLMDAVSALKVENPCAIYGTGITIVS